jgi:hypothetical protein
MEQLIADLDRMRVEGQRLGLYPSSDAFEKAWKNNTKKFSMPQSRALLSGVPLSQMSLAIYGGAQADIAQAIDAADPTLASRRQAVGLPTPGEVHLQAEEVRHSSWRDKLSLAAVGGAAAGVGYFLVRKVSDTFFFGPVTRLTSSVMGPVMNPVQEKLDMTVNRHVTPRFVPWAQWVRSGDARASSASRRASRSISQRSQYDHGAHLLSTSLVQ